MALIGLPDRHIDLAAMKLATIFTTLALFTFPSYSQITIAFPPQGTVVIPDSEITVEIRAPVIGHWPMSSAAGWLRLANHEGQHVIVMDSVSAKAWSTAAVRTAVVP